MGKHNGSFGKQYGKVVGKDADERPGWKGPIKKTEVPKKEKAKKAPRIEEEREEVIVEPSFPIELQQLLLSIFRDAFPDVINSDSLQPLLQDVKAALYERDFSRAFGNEEYLEAYSIRWSPSRALCYVSILAELRDQLAEVFSLCAGGDSGRIRAGHSLKTSSTISSEPDFRSVCFGGGAAEVVAFGGFLRILQGVSLSLTKSPDPADAIKDLSLREKQAEMDIMFIDSAQWQNVVDKLQESLSSLPVLPKYANAASRAANSALLAPGSITVNFQHEDVLALSPARLAEIVQGRQLLTLLFTLNELYTASMAKTTTLLLNLTLTTKSGTLLLVVDSPGSYSEVAVGSEAKKYPMQLLLDHTLLGSRKAEKQVTEASWVKVVSKDAQWFRLAAELQYPIQLENMRYQMHLYRRI